MRVVATKDFKTYYRMVPVRVEKGREYSGPFAEFMLKGRCPVEVVDGEQATDATTTGDTTGAELDIDGTAAQILGWVGDDAERAREALDAENAKEKPRSTLVKKLEELAGE